ncbi:MAG: AMP-binding protein [Gemmatimonadetes bacterium]|nr:AMP-binding protein [Gemmatimonadota bacterium]
MTIADFATYTDPVRAWARATPDKCAIVSTTRDPRATGSHRSQVSYAQLDDAAGRWAALLTAEGIAAGDRVAVLSMNRVELVALLYGCGRIGAALVPLNWRLSSAELQRIVADAQPKLIVGESRFADRRVAVAGDVTWLDLDADAPTVLATMRPNADATLALESIAIVLYTSGSTGRPKGAMLSQRQLLFNAIATNTGWNLGAEDIAPISTPFFHTGGWNVFSTPMWLAGGTVVLLDGFDAATFLDALAAERCTVAFGVPTQLVMLAESAAWGRELPDLRWFACGGAPCPPQLAARVHGAGYKLRLGFGMTEFGPNCFGTSDEMAVAKPESVGWPMPFVQMRLVDEQMADVATGEVGELLLRGPQLFSGYLNDPVRTAEAMTPDGWLRTGDLASRDADGAYTIRGRRKDMFISGGENVFPGEIEASLADCEGVAEAVVVGVPHAKWGEVGHGFVQPRTGAAPDVNVLLATLRERLAHYKVPKALEIVAELPRIGSGKVDRAALRRRAEEMAR